MTKHIVTNDDLERNLNRVKGFSKIRGNSKTDGVFGPGSAMWRIGQESCLFIGSAYALMLQEAHPWVAVGAHNHSKVRKDPQRRWKNTFKAVNAMIYGDLDTAMKYARIVHKIHNKVKGTTEDGEEYSANQEDALLWVGATLAYTSIMTHEFALGPMAHEEKEEYYKEFKYFLYMFGLSDETIPSTWNEFIDYYDDMLYSGKLQVGDHAREMIGHFVDKFETLPGVLTWPLDCYMAFTAGLLPANIRQGYKMKDTLKEKIMYRAVKKSIRLAYSTTPEKLRESPAYRSAMKRVEKARV